MFLKCIDWTWHSDVAREMQKHHQLEWKISANMATIRAEDKAICSFASKTATGLTPGLDSLSLYFGFSASIIITACLFPGELIENIPFVFMKKEMLSYPEDDPRRNKLLTYQVSKSSTSTEPLQTSLYHKSSLSSALYLQGTRKLANLFNSPLEVFWFLNNRSNDCCLPKAKEGIGGRTEITLEFLV